MADGKVRRDAIDIIAHDILARLAEKSGKWGEGMHWAYYPGIGIDDWGRIRKRTGRLGRNIAPSREDLQSALELMASRAGEGGY